MRRYNNHTIWFAAFLLLIFSPGCCNTGANQGTNPGLTPPTVISVAPVAGAAGVCPNTILTATFSVAMNSTSINGATFTLTGPGTTPVAGVVTYDAPSKTATFTPSSPLALSTLYTATITTGATDEVGVALASNFVWTFTTGSNPCVPPTVISVTPPNGATSVCPSTVVTATFSQPMNPATINTTTFTLTGPGTTPVTGVVTYAASTATFIPSSPLALGTLYIATITTGAQDLAGYALARIIREVEDARSLFCYKHVVKAVFVLQERLPACSTIARHSVCYSPTFSTSLPYCSSTNGWAVPMAGPFC